MKRLRLKNTVIALLNDILYGYSEEDLQSLIDDLSSWFSENIRYGKPIHISDYDHIVKKLTKTLDMPPRKKAVKKPQEKKPKESIYPNIVTVNVPITMDVSKLSKMERSILCQHMDEMHLITYHQTSHHNGIIKTRAKIGIAVRHLWPEQKEYTNIKTDYITVQKPKFYKSYIQSAYMIYIPLFIMDICSKHIIKDHIYFNVPP